MQNQVSIHPSIHRSCDVTKGNNISPVFATTSTPSEVCACLTLCEQAAFCLRFTDFLYNESCYYCPVNTEVIAGHLTWRSDIQKSAGVRVLPVLIRDGAAMLTHDKLHRHPAKTNKSDAQQFFLPLFFPLSSWRRPGLRVHVFNIRL